MEYEYTNKNTISTKKKESKKKKTQIRTPHKNISFFYVKIQCYSLFYYV